MIDYTGIECPICKKAFTETDDIVVCPECGAPYHRECYQKVKHCVFEDKHGTAEAWTPPADRQNTSGNTQREPEERTKVCPRCGNQNFPNALFCDKCGMLLPSSPGNDPNASPYGAPRYQNYGGYPPTSPMGPIMMDPMGGVSPNDTIADIPAGDVAKYVKVNTQYYLPAFKYQDTLKSSRFNFCAFFFSGGWLLYRKQYKSGVILTVIMALLLIGSSCVNMFYSYDILQQMAGKAGLEAATGFAFFSTDMNAFIAQFNALDGLQKFLLVLPTVLSIVQLILMIIVGIKGNKMYYKHCVQSIRKIKADASGEAEYADRLQKEGGVNPKLALFLLFCYLLITYLPLFL